VGSTVSSARLVSQFAAARARERSGRQLVAAVCYRIGARGVEFLLVRTRGGRWIFPKGGVVPGLTHAQSAALEAFEEAGVHGRIEEIPFARYRHGKSESSQRQTRSGTTKPVVAHLCEVSHLERPQEENRKPTWFSAEKAKRRLLEDRCAEFGDQLASVVDRALARIRRREGRRPETDKDDLQKVRIDGLRNNLLETRRPPASLVQYFMLERRALARSIEDGAGQNACVAPNIPKLLQPASGQFVKAPLPSSFRRIK
jgi:8-oxo-dGTP pyrophosphatase MutT (NUDIX family)